MEIVKGEVTTVIINPLLVVFISVLFMMLGNVITNKVKIFKKLCLPAPVIGGLVFAIINLLLHSFVGVEIELDDTILNFFTLIFFTTLGYAIDLSVLKKSGKLILIFFILTIVLTFIQNFVAVGISKATGLSPLVGLMAGSPSLVGGHSNAAAFGTIVEDMGHIGAVTFGMAASTYGLFAGVLLGNIALELIVKRNKLSTVAKDVDFGDDNDSKAPLMFNEGRFMKAMFTLVITMGVGLVLYVIWSQVFPNIQIAALIWGMIVAIFVKIGKDKKGKTMPVEEMQTIGKTFLAMLIAGTVAAMKLWQLAGMGIPLILILTANTIITFIFVITLTFRLCGKDYDAACIADGQFGFGMGSVIVSVANLDEVSKKYSSSKIAYFVVPIVGATLSNISNSLITTLFINIFG